MSRWLWSLWWGCAGKSDAPPASESAPIETAAPDSETEPTEADTAPAAVSCEAGGGVGATFTPTDGAPVDVSAVFASGSEDAPALWVADVPGTLRVCEGVWHVRLDVRAPLEVVPEGVVVLDGGRAGAVVTVDGASVSMTGLEVRGGRDDRGGGVSCAAGGVALSDVRVVDNEADRGGGLGGEGCAWSLIDVAVEGNRAREGAGLWVTGGSVVSAGSSVRSNVASEVGGGAWMAGADTRWTDGAWSDNVAVDGAAAVLASGSWSCLRDAGGPSVTRNAASAGVAFRYGAGAALVSEGCDWGDDAAPGDDNHPVDLTGPTGVGADYRADATFSCGDAGCFPVDVPPILVAPVIHVDPIPTDAVNGPVVYEQHREALLWVQAALEARGAALSAFMTGPYAEAVVHTGDFADFADYGPGKRHQLGSHLHNHWKGPDDGDWEWTGIADFEAMTDEELVASFEDQVPWVNQIFVANGHLEVANDFLHGTSIDLGEEMVPWFGLSEPTVMSYPNRFVAQLGAERGMYHPYRANWVLRGDEYDVSAFEDPSAEVVRIPMASGLIGYDQEHFEEGFVYGTVPYIQREAVFVWLEWREVARGATHGHGRPFVFSWSTHPYQVNAIAVGTDGILVRTSYETLLSWLHGRWFDDAPSVQGVPVARFGTMADGIASFEAWDAATDGVTAMNANADGTPVRALDALLTPLDTSSWVADLEGAPKGVDGVWLRTEEGARVLLLWSDLGAIEVSGLGTFSEVRASDGSVRAGPFDVLIADGAPIAATSL